MTSKTRFFDIPSLPDPQIYSHGAITGPSPQLIYTSGQLGQRSDGSFPVTRREEIAQALQNVVKVVEAGGAEVRDIVKFTFLAVDWEFTKANEFFEGLVGHLMSTHGVQTRPTTTLIPVPCLADPRASFEVEAIAAIKAVPGVWTSNDQSIDKTPAPLKTDVVVIGGGFAGMQAAYDIYSSGHTCIVLEATDRIGGRSYSKKLTTGPGLIELGATWINELTQPKAYALAQQFGLTCKTQYETGASIWQSSNGETWRVERGLLPLPPSSQDEKDDLVNLLQVVEEEQGQIEVKKPGKLNAADDMTVEEWIKAKGLTPWPASFMRNLVSSLVGREADEVGLHYILDYIKSGGGFESLASEGKWGAQSLKIKQGTSAIAAGLAGALPAGAVLLNNAAISIEHHADRCTVTTACGVVINSARVIFATPTNEYTNIRITPPLPPAKRALATRTRPGRYNKVVLTYDHPWWKDLDLVGSFWSMKGPINFSWETSDDETKSYSLALFVAGDCAVAFESQPTLAREEAIIEHLIELVGHEHAERIRNIREINMIQWSERKFFGGAPTSSMGSGDLARYGEAMRASFGKLYFGGGETAYEWKGYLEGALRSGSRVAEEVIASLGMKSKM